MESARKNITRYHWLLRDLYCAYRVYSIAQIYEHAMTLDILLQKTTTKQTDPLEDRIMGTSKNPAKAAEQRKISQVGDFKARLGGVQELPSGVIVKVRNPGGLQAFLSSGLIPNGLMGIVQKALKRGKGLDAKELMDEDGNIDPQMLADMGELLNNITLKVVVEPPINPIPTQADLDAWNREHPDEQYNSPESLRSDELLYVDEFPDEDKQFLFQWISGGTRDLEKFRQQQLERMASLSAVTGIGTDA